MQKTFDQRLAELGHQLPEILPTEYSYEPVVQFDRLLFVSGQIPRVNGETPYLGKLGAGVSVIDGQEAAILCILSALSQLKAHLGTLDRLERVLKLNGYVASEPTFTQHPIVVDAASKLLEKLFPGRGHARAAIGVSSLPRDVPVEIELIAGVQK